MVMNTALARRLALGERVVWVGKDGDQPAGLGTITRITAHEVEVRWDGATARRYRRAHLHNLRHAQFISGALHSDIRLHVEIRLPPHPEERAKHASRRMGGH
jgi:hypothetical protein